MVAGHITPEALLIGQKCQVESFHGLIPCSLQSKTSLLARTTACTSLCSSSSASFNIQEYPTTSPLEILIGVGNLFLWLWVSGGVYRNKYVNILECSFVLNLIILTTVTYCVKLFRGNQRIVGYTWTISVSIVFATFIGIVAFQLANVTGITQYLKRKRAALKLATMNQNEAKAELRSPTDSLPDRLLNPDDYEPSLYTMPLLSQQKELMKHRED